MTHQVSGRAELGKTVMLELAIPNHPEQIEALGRLAIAYTQLELVLRYMVKTLSGLTIKEALDATNRERTSDTRQRIRRLFLEKNPTATETSKLDALLGEAKRLAEKRNDYLHSAWSISTAGKPIIKSEDHYWGPAPGKAELDNVASELLALSKKINVGRSRGFIKEVIDRNLAR